MLVHDSPRALRFNLSLSMRVRDRRLLVCAYVFRDRIASVVLKATPGGHDLRT